MYSGIQEGDGSVFKMFEDPPAAGVHIRQAVAKLCLWLFGLGSDAWLRSIFLPHVVFRPILVFSFFSFVFPFLI